MVNGPLELFYSVQSVLCALAVVGLMKLVTTIIDLTYGKEQRKTNKWLSRLILPAGAVVLGMLYGAFVPFRPAFLEEHVAEHVESFWLAALAFGSWGAACGQFAQTLHDRAKDLFAGPRS